MAPLIDQEPESGGLGARRQIGLRKRHVYGLMGVDKKDQDLRFSVFLCL